MHEKKVSVIMGVYNPVEEYLVQAVKSILNQTYKNFEFIICDDGSTQNIEIFKKLKTLDERLIIIKNDSNMGLAYSLNKCISISSGEYIARQDDDDISERNRLNIQIDFLEKHSDYSFVGSNIILFDENGEYSNFIFPKQPINNDFLFTSPFNHGSIIFRKKDLLEVNAYRVSKETRRCEDYDLFIRMYLDGKKGYNLQKYLYKFREDNNAKKRRRFKYRIDDMLVRKRYFKKMDFGLKRYFYIVKPVLVGLLPISLLNSLKRIYYKK